MLNNSQNSSSFSHLLASSKFHFPEFSKHLRIDISCGCINGTDSTLTLWLWQHLIHSVNCFSFFVSKVSRESFNSVLHPPLFYWQTMFHYINVVLKFLTMAIWDSKMEKFESLLLLSINMIRWVCSIIRQSIGNEEMFQYLWKLQSTKWKCLYNFLTFWQTPYYSWLLGNLSLGAKLKQISWSFLKASGPKLRLSPPIWYKIY